MLQNLEETSHSTADGAFQASSALWVSQSGLNWRYTSPKGGPPQPSTGNTTPEKRGGSELLSRWTNWEKLREQQQGGAVDVVGSKTGLN